MRDGGLLCPEANEVQELFERFLEIIVHDFLVTGARMISFILGGFDPPIDICLAHVAPSLHSLSEVLFPGLRNIDKYTD